MCPSSDQKVSCSLVGIVQRQSTRYMYPMPSVGLYGTASDGLLSTVVTYCKYLLFGLNSFTQMSRGMQSHVTHVRLICMPLSLQPALYIYMYNVALATRGIVRVILVYVQKYFIRAPMSI